MSSTSASTRKADVWRVLDYEVQMFLGIGHIRTHLKIDGGGESQLIRNALVESSLLHIRILTDIFLSRGNRHDDINLELLGFDPKSNEPTLTDMINTLATAYGEAGNKDSNCWIINKRLAHPTTHRTRGYNYSKVFEAMDKPLKSIIEYVYGSAKRSLPYPLRP